MSFDGNHFLSYHFFGNQFTGNHFTNSHCWQSIWGQLLCQCVVSSIKLFSTTSFNCIFFKPPKHAPVVIQLSKEDFESDDDGEQNKSIQSCNAELDQLFQQARTESTVLFSYPLNQINL